jgi:hypothetical protein
MIRRPKATETEEDLLSLQESFLASGEVPSASLHRVSKPRAGVQVGEKRRELAGGGEEEWRDQPAGRDVVQLHTQGQKAQICPHACHMPGTSPVRAQLDTCSGLGTRLHSAGSCVCKVHL